MAALAPARAWSACRAARPRASLCRRRCATSSAQRRGPGRLAVDHALDRAALHHARERPLVADDAKGQLVAAQPYILERQVAAVEPQAPRDAGELLLERERRRLLADRRRHVRFPAA